MILPLKIKLPDQTEVTLSLSPQQHPNRFSLKDNVLWFDLPRGKAVHLQSNDPVCLTPDTPHTLHWSAMLHGGRAALWWLEHDQNQRLSHWTADIHQGHQQHLFKTHPDHDSARLSIELKGAGHLWIEKLILTIS